jgi:hypothetical protein
VVLASGRCPSDGQPAQGGGLWTLMLSFSVSSQSVVMVLEYLLILMSVLGLGYSSQPKI